MSGGLSEKAQELSGPSISSGLRFMPVTFTLWPLEETELETGAMERMVKLFFFFFSTKSWLCFFYALCSKPFCLSFSLPPLSFTQYLSLSSRISRHAHTHTHTVCHTRVCVLTHNPRQFLLLFKGISSESNYISGEGGLNSFWNPTLF